MKNIYMMIAALILTACASTHNAAQQNYRVKGESEPLQITGKLDAKGGLSTTDYALSIFFNEKPQISGNLSEDATGELQGENYNGKKTATSCSSQKVNEDTLTVNCIVFVDNERTVTLTF